MNKENNLNLNLKFKIEFDAPTKKTKYETVSKFLNDETELYFFIKDCQEKIKHSGVRIIDKLEPCIRILKQNENKLDKSQQDTLFITRIKRLQNLEIDMADKNNYETINNQLVYNINLENEKYSIVLFQLTHKALNKNKYLNIILNPEYSTYTEHEFTGSCD
jgi:hypothetical protein